MKTKLFFALYFRRLPLSISKPSIVKYITPSLDHPNSIYDKKRWYARGLRREREGAEQGSIKVSRVRLRTNSSKIGYPAHPLRYVSSPFPLNRQIPTHAPIFILLFAQTLSLYSSSFLSSSFISIIITSPPLFLPPNHSIIAL